MATTARGPDRFALVSASTLLLWAVFALWIPLVPVNVYRPLLDLGKMTGYTWASALHYLALVLGLFGLYLLAYRGVRAGVTDIRRILLVAACSCAILLLAYPATAVDVFGYAAQGRVLALERANPFFTPPSALRDTTLRGYLAYPDEPSQYGPLWAIISGLVAVIAQRNLLAEVLLFKSVAAVTHLASAWLVFLIARRLGADQPKAAAGALLFAWNPLLLWEMVGNAHNDGLMALGLLAAAWLLVAGKHRLVLPAVAAGALVKLPAAVLAPVLAVSVGWWRRRWVALAEGVALAGSLVVLLYWVFWQGPRTITALYRTEQFTASLANLVRLLLEPALGGDAARLARLLTLAVLVLALASVLSRSWRSAARCNEALLLLSYRVLLLFLLLFITWFQAWYVVWPFALGAALPRTRVHRELVLLSFGAMASYFVFIYLWVMDVLPGGVLAVQAAATGAIVGPLLAAWVVTALVDARRGASGHGARPRGPRAS